MVFFTSTSSDFSDTCSAFLLDEAVVFSDTDDSESETAAVFLGFTKDDISCAAGKEDEEDEEVDDDDDDDDDEESKDELASMAFLASSIWNSISSIFKRKLHVNSCHDR